MAAGWRERFADSLGARTGRIGTSYVVRTTMAATASLELARAFHIANPIWAVVSAVVVILPEIKGSVASAGLRVVANLIGAGIGVAIAQVDLPMIAAMIAGLIAVAAACRWLALDGAARSAGVALMIVLMRDERGVLGSSETRVVLVMLGCATALVVTLVVAGAENQASAWLARWRASRRDANG